MTRELEPDNAGARSHCVAAHALRAFNKALSGFSSKPEKL
jgi:hypothetical protein